VAYYLGNTPAVCRASYVDPRIVDRYRAGVTIADALDSGEVAAIEAAVLELLEDAPAVTAVAA
jgi:DNA topoisomerase IB